MALNELRELRAAVNAAGFSLEVNQAGPLLEQMAREHGDIRILTGNDGRFNVEWSGAYGVADSILEAAMRCIAMYGGKRCKTAEFGCECGRPDTEPCPLPFVRTLGGGANNG